MKVLGLDLETTGVDLVKDRVIEIGMVLYDTVSEVPLKMFSEFINEPDQPVERDSFRDESPITDKMIEVHGLNMLAADHKNGLFEIISDMIEGAEYIVAHNGNKFDRIVLENFFKRYDQEFPSVPWIDTITDIVYPRHCAARNLIYLAGYHGFVNPFPHRAFFAVMTMLKIMSEYDMGEIIERMVSPMITLKANVSYQDKDYAKNEHFMWNPDKKIWYKDVKECDVTDEWIESLKFSIDVLEG